jgi:hypothetical protein
MPSLTTGPPSVSFQDLSSHVDNKEEVVFSSIYTGNDEVEDKEDKDEQWDPPMFVDDYEDDT